MRPPPKGPLCSQMRLPSLVCLCGFMVRWAYLSRVELLISLPVGRFNFPCTCTLEVDGEVATDCWKTSWAESGSMSAGVVADTGPFHSSVGAILIVSMHWQQCPGIASILGDFHPVRPDAGQHMPSFGHSWLGFDPLALARDTNSGPSSDNIGPLPIKPGPRSTRLTNIGPISRPHVARTRPISADVGRRPIPSHFGPSPVQFGLISARVGPTPINALPISCVGATRGGGTRGNLEGSLNNIVYDADPWEPSTPPMISREID